MLNGKNSNENWRVVIVDSARKQLERIPRGHARKISRAIDTLKTDPYTGDASPLRGEENSWRRRVGAYRILYDVLSQERIVFVYEIARRTSSTY